MGEHEVLPLRENLTLQQHAEVLTNALGKPHYNGGLWFLEARWYVEDAEQTVQVQRHVRAMATTYYVWVGEGRAQDTGECFWFMSDSAKIGYKAPGETKYVASTSPEEHTAAIRRYLHTSMLDLDNHTQPASESEKFWEIAETFMLTSSDVIKGLVNGVRELHAKKLPNRLRKLKAVLADALTGDDTLQLYLPEGRCESAVARSLLLETQPEPAPEQSRED